MEQGQVHRHDALHLVSHKDLIAVELDLVALQIHLVAHLGKVEYACQGEGVIHIKVYPKKRLVSSWVELAVELTIVLVRKVLRFAEPERVGVVDHIVLLGILHLAVLPLLLLTKDNGDREEATILRQ